MCLIYFICLITTLSSKSTYKGRLTANNPSAKPSLHLLLAPRKSCVEPLSHDAFLLLKFGLPLPPLPLYVYSHLHSAWQQAVVFAGEERKKTAPGLTKNK